MSFRIFARSFALTYPQCAVLPSEFLRVFLTKVKKLSWVYVVREKHSDGHLHLHVALFLESKWDVKDPRLFDVDYDGTQYHGNYQGCRDIKAWFEYLRKSSSDPDFMDAVAGMTLEEIMSTFNAKKSGGAKRTINEAFKRLCDGESMADLLGDQDLVGAVILHGPKLQAAYHLFARAHASAPKQLFDLSIRPSGDAETDVKNQFVVDWLKANLVGKPKRQHRQRQLWLGGVKRCGKTSFVIQLAEFFRVYWVPMGEDYYDQYDDSDYDLVVFEEMCGQKTVSFMNSFCDGQPLFMKKKGSQIFKKKNIPVICLSNYTIEQCYHGVVEKNRESLLALQDRFSEVYFYSPYVAIDLVESPAPAPVTSVVLTEPVVEVPDEPQMSSSSSLVCLPVFAVDSYGKRLPVTPTVDLEEEPSVDVVIVGLNETEPILALSSSQISKLLVPEPDGFVAKLPSVKCRHASSCDCTRYYLSSFRAYGVDPGPVHMLRYHPKLMALCPKPPRCMLTCVFDCLSSACGHGRYWTVGVSDPYLYFNGAFRPKSEVSEFLFSNNSIPLNCEE